MAQTTNMDLPLLLTLDDLITASNRDKNWVLSLIDEAVIQPEIHPELSTDEEAVYFNSVQLTKIRRASRLRRDFDASPQAIGLILSLLDELRPLRQLQRQITVTRIVQDVASDIG